MATPRAVALLQQLNSDTVLRQQLENAGGPEERRRVVDAAGYSDVTREDLQEALQEQAGTTELSDAELEAVAGGRTTSWLSFITAVTALAL
jgi:predicted ribosomally synthesized peptide with nif11-like leader